MKEKKIVFQTQNVTNTMLINDNVNELANFINGNNVRDVGYQIVTALDGCEILRIVVIYGLRAKYFTVACCSNRHQRNELLRALDDLSKMFVIQ